jgi:hypothetical protein
MTPSVAKTSAYLTERHTQWRLRGCSVLLLVCGAVECDISNFATAHAAQPTKPDDFRQQFKVLVRLVAATALSKHHLTVSCSGSGLMESLNSSTHTNGWQLIMPFEVCVASDQMPYFIT